jgi:uncharacterized membrane protein YhdT
MPVDWPFASLNNLHSGRGAHMNNSPDADLIKEKFDLGIAMLKGYYDGLESRAERAAVLLVGVVGWLITSASARESLANSRLLFWSALFCISLFFVLTAANIYHFLTRFREIELEVKNLNYMDPKYFARYRMPMKIKGIPIGGIYLAPMFIVYVFIVLFLVGIKFSFQSVTHFH